MLSDHGVSVHEAGHLIVAAALGWTPTGASIDADGGRAYYTRAAGATAADDLCIALAGPLAESRATGHLVVLGTDLTTCLDSLENIVGFKPAFGWLDLAPAAAARKRAEGILQVNAAAVDHVGYALQQKRRLSAADLAALLGLKAPAAASYTARTAPVSATLADAEARLAGIAPSGKDAWDLAAAALDPKTRDKVRAAFGQVMPGQRTGLKLANGSPRFAGIGPHESATPAARARALRQAVQFVSAR